MENGLYNRIIAAMEQYGDCEIAWDGDESLTYSSLLSAADVVCAKLRSIGITPGEHVALCGYNSCNWLKAFLGIIKSGAVAVLLNYAAYEDDLQERIKSMDCSCLLYGKCKVYDSNPEAILRLAPDASRCINIDSFTYEQKTVFEPLPLSDDDYNAPAYIIFTSGSTGKPKGSMLSQQCGIVGADAFVSMVPDMQSETICMGLPIFHAFGISMALTHLLHGGRLLLPRTLASENMISIMTQRHTDAIAAVMTVLLQLIENEKLPHIANNIQRLYTGGATLIPIQLLRVNNVLRNAVVLNVYGQSESDNGITMTVPNDSFDKRVQTVGKPLPHRCVKILSSAGDVLPVGKIGEIVVRDDGNITRGYYSLPAEQQPVDESGYLHTGDLGFWDEDGYLHFVGRIKDIIIKGGENIIPQEVEREISTIDGICDVKVLGAPNELYGESIEACVIMQPGKVFDENALKNQLKDKLPRFKCPSHFFVFDTFPHKANGKLDACELKIQLLNRLSQRMIEDNIVNGISLLSITTKSQRYVISSICRVASDVVQRLGFIGSEVDSVMLCVEELLIERVNQHYLDIGNLYAEFIIWPDFLRVRFSDEKIDNPLSVFGNMSEQSISVKIILAKADRISVEKDDTGRQYLNMDFLFHQDFDFMEFFKQ